MSHQPSPSPSLSHHQQHLPSTSVSSRHKLKSFPFVTGITAGAEDVKYQAKHKELKRKVKEIEADNDKLYIKVLQAKRSIQRMRLERAILYERLCSVPPSPEKHENQPLPPIHTGPGVIPPQGMSHGTSVGRRHENHEQPPRMDTSDHALMDYIRTHGNVRVVAGPDGRPIPVPETHMGPGVAPPSAHGLQLYDARHLSAGLDSARQLPRLPDFIPPPSNPRHHGGSHLQHHSGSPHERYRSSHVSSRSRSHQSSLGHHSDPSHAPPFATDNLPPVHHVLQHSDDREWGRRHNLREIGNSHDSRPQMSSQAIVPHSAHPYPHDGRLPGPGRTQSQSRIGSLIRHDIDRERDYDRERDWAEQEMAREREMDLGTFQSHRSRSVPERMEYQERSDYNDRSTSRAREEPGLYAGSGNGPGYMISRSGTPGSGSGSGYGGDAVPRSDGNFFERDRARYISKAPNQTINEEPDLVADDGRSKRSRDPNGGGGAGPEHTRPSLDSRRRMRHDMEVGENDVGGSGSGGREVASGHPGDLGVSRYQTDSNSRDRDNGHEEKVDG